MSIRPGYSQLYYDVEKSDTLYYFSINTDNRFDNPIYFAIGYGKSSAILSVKELIEFAEQGNKGEETISVPGLYTENRLQSIWDANGYYYDVVAVKHIVRRLVKRCE